MDQQDNPPVSLPPGSDQLNQTGVGDINAHDIIATHVVSGNQYNIEKQEIHHHAGECHRRTPPLYRPARADHFTGREQEQRWLLDHLTPGKIVTLCGPGGMGKTALVAEVLWILFPDEILTEIFPDGLIFHDCYREPTTAIALEQIARIFGEDPLPTPALAAQRALNRRKMLLVLDGAEELDDLRHLLEVCARQTVLIVSRKRTDAVDLRFLLDLHPLPSEHAVAVVRAWGEEQATDEPTLQRICQLVGNLPLALSLVGQYLALHQEEAREYVQWLEESPLAVLDQGMSQRESVPVLLSRSVARVSKDAQQVLAVVGMLALAPFDRVTIVQVLNLSVQRTRQAFHELHEYGLLHVQMQYYQVSHALIHTYAREVLLAAYNYARRRELASRLIQVLNERISTKEEINQEVHEKLLPHIQECLIFLDQEDLAMDEMASLFAQAGSYLSERIRYTEAEPLLQRVLEIYKRQLGPEHPNTANSLNNLAVLYERQGKYAEAEPLFQRVLTIFEHVLGPEHLDTASCLHNLAHLYRAQGKHKEAEPLYQHALAIREQVLGPEHPKTLNTMNSLGILYRTQARYEEARRLLQRALAICERVLGPIHLDTAQSLNNLAALHRTQGKYEEAEPLFLRVLAIREHMLGPEHPDTARSLNNLAALYQDQGRYEEAEPLLQRALAIYEKVLGLEHPDTAQSLNGMGLLYRTQGKYEEAEPLFLRALTIREHMLGPEHPDTARSLNNLATLYQDQKKYEKVEQLLQRAQTIFEKMVGLEHSDAARTLNNLAIFYQTQRQYKKAEPLLQRALAIHEQVLGPEHLDTAQSLNNLAALYWAQEKYEEVEPLLQRTLVICEQQLGLKHPDTANSLNTLASLYTSQGKYAEAEPLLQRALAIYEQVLGLEHPDMRAVQANYTALLQRMKPDERHAEDL